MKRHHNGPGDGNEFGLPDLRVHRRKKIHELITSPYSAMVRAELAGELRDRTEYGDTLMSISGALRGRHPLPQLYLDNIIVATFKVEDDSAKRCEMVRGFSQALADLLHFGVGWSIYTTAKIENTPLARGFEEPGGSVSPIKPHRHLRSVK